MTLYEPPKADDYDFAEAIVKDGIYVIGEERLARFEITMPEFLRLVGVAIERKLQRWIDEQKAREIASH